MAEFDLPLEDLVRYTPPLTARPDFDAFWARALGESAGVPLQSEVREVPYPYDDIAVARVSFRGTDGTIVNGWYVRPTGAPAPLPVMLRFHGYGESERLRPYQLASWCSLGMAVVALETRGQPGETHDRAVYEGPSVAGWLTKSLLDPEHYYYRNVYLDCVRALDFIAERPELDSSRIVVHGESQGGALALAVAALDSRPKLAMPVFPFLCHFERSVRLQVGSPYEEIPRWFAQFDADRTLDSTVWNTLSYFDVMNLAPRVTAHTLMGITLQDTTCPPSASFAAYNHLVCEKEVEVLPDWGHVGLIPHLQERMMWFLREHL